MKLSYLLPVANRPKIMVTVGVLALQGDFRSHCRAISHLNMTAIEVRCPEDLSSCSSLIIPGGESTTIAKQLHFSKLVDPIKDFAKTHPILGTCAGIILMSKKVHGIEPEVNLNLLDIEVQRNGFGRQKESFHTPLSIYLKSDDPIAIEGVFIRAPRVLSVGKKG